MCKYYETAYNHDCHRHCHCSRYAYNSPYFPALDRRVGRNRPGVRRLDWCRFGWRRFNWRLLDWRRFSWSWLDWHRFGRRRFGRRRFGRRRFGWCRFGRLRLRSIQNGFKCPDSPIDVLGTFLAGFQRKRLQGKGDSLTSFN